MACAYQLLAKAIIVHVKAKKGHMHERPIDVYDSSQGKNTRVQVRVSVQVNIIIFNFCLLHVLCAI